MPKEVRITPAAASTTAAPASPSRSISKLSRSTSSYLASSQKAISTSLNSNWSVEEYILKRRREGTLTKGDLIYRALANPASSGWALLLAGFLLISALASVIVSAYILSVEAHERQLGITCVKEPGATACSMSEAMVWDIAFLAIFGLEVIARALVFVRPWAQVSIWIELCCCVPLIMRLVLASNGLRPLELHNGLRTVAILVQAIVPLRLLKLARYSSAAVILKKAIADSSSALWIPFYLLTVLFTLVGGLVYAFEYDPDNYDPSSGQIHTVLEGWWMMLVTMVTVGYGDYSPQSVPGRMLTGVAMCMGLCFTAMPLAIVGNTFSTAWEARALATIREQLKKHLLDKGLNATNCEEAFANFDLDGNGCIDYTEFKHVVVGVLGIPLDVKKLRKVWRSLDQDDSNIIKYQEFCLAVFPEYEFNMDSPAEPTCSSSSSTTKSVDGSNGPGAAYAGRASPDLVTEFKGGKDADAPAQPGSRVGSAGSRRSVEDRLARVEVAVSQQQGLQAELKRCQEQQQELQATMQQLLAALKEKS